MYNVTPNDLVTIQRAVPKQIENLGLIFWWRNVAVGLQIMMRGISYGKLVIALKLYVGSVFFLFVQIEDCMQRS